VGGGDCSEESEGEELTSAVVLWRRWKRRKVGIIGKVSSVFPSVFVVCVGVESGQEPGSVGMKKRMRMGMEVETEMRSLHAFLVTHPNSARQPLQCVTSASGTHVGRAK